MIRIDINKQKVSLTQLDLESLKNAQVIARVEELAQDSEFELESAHAREFYEALDGLMKKHGKQFEGSEEYKRLNVVLIKMMWQALPALDKKNKDQILSNNLLAALKNKVDILTNLDVYLDLFEFGVGPNFEQRRMLGVSLDQNQERLGLQPIQLKIGQEVAPYLSNWLKDFVSYTDPKSLKGISYELTQYLYSSPNVKNLKPDERQILSQVIAIYDHIHHPGYLPEIVGGPGTTPVTQAPPLPKPTAPPSHGADLEALKRKLEENKINFKQAAQVPVTPAVKMTLEEIKREVGTKELNVHEIDRQPAEGTKMPFQERSKSQKGIFVAPMALRSLNDIQTVDDLKKIDLKFLRMAPLQKQILDIRNQISNLAQANRVLPYYTVNAFEQSPLFKAYLKHGSSKILAQTDTGDLTQQEFEAIADLRKEIERL